MTQPFEKLATWLKHLPSVHPVNSCADKVLLERWLQHRDQDALLSIVHRHGGMVLRVCQRLLHNEHDAEDAFQATFLILTGKADSIRNRDSLASWLHGVAIKVSHRVRKKQANVSSEVAPEIRESSENAPLENAVWNEFRGIVDEEIQHLPAKYREPFIRCDLQGQAQADVAQELGVPPGTMSWCLNKARQTLRTRLQTRGVTLTSGTFALVLTQQMSASGVPEALTNRTFIAGLVHGSTSATHLADTLIRSWTMKKITMAITLVLTLSALSLGAGIVMLRMPAPGTPPAAGQTLVLAPIPKPKPPTDAYGDELPVGAATRLGTSRLRHPIQLPHGGQLHFDPTGTLLISSGRREVRLWEAQTGRLVTSLKHKQDVTQTCLSKKGDRLACLLRDGTVVVWDLTSTRELTTLKPDPKDPLHFVHWHPNGSELALVDRALRIRLWQVETGAKRLLFEEKMRQFNRDPRAEPGELDFSPDAKLMAIGGDQLRLYDFATGKLLKTLAKPNHAGYVWTYVRFVDDGKQLLTRKVVHPRKVGNPPATSVLWEVRRGVGIAQRPGHGYPFGTRVTPSGKLLEWGQANRSFNLLPKWTTRIGQRFTTQHSGTLDVVCSPGGDRFASFGREGRICVWDAKTGSDLHQFPFHPGTWKCARFSPDGKQVVTVDDLGTIQVWDASSGKLYRQMKAGYSKVWGVGWLPDGKSIITSCGDNENADVSIWEVDSQRLKSRWKVPRAFTQFIFTDSGRTVIMGGGGPLLQQWDLRKGMKVREAHDPEGNVIQSMSLKAKHLITVTTTETETLIQARDRQLSPIRTVKLSGPMGTVATGGQRFTCSDGLKTVTVDARSGNRVSEWKHPDRWLGPSALAPDGKTLAVASASRCLMMLVDVETGKKTLSWTHGHTRGLSNLAFSPDGKRLLSISQDGTAIIWNLRQLRVSQTHRVRG